MMTLSRSNHKLFFISSYLCTSLISLWNLSKVHSGQQKLLELTY